MLNKWMIMAARDQFDTLAPEFAIRINGSALPNEAVADIISMNIVEDLDAPSMCTVTLSGWDTVEMKVKWIDHKLFREGNPVEIEMGYRDHLQLVFNGEITGLEPDFPEARPPIFTVRAYDRRHRLMRRRNTHSFLNLKDSDIARPVGAPNRTRPESGGQQSQAALCPAAQPD